jgi:dipeptidyl aminopeptidase/acylaminoacyl peptidase
MRIWLWPVVCGCAFAPLPGLSTAEESTTRNITATDIFSLREIGGEDGSLSVSPDGSKVAVQIHQANFAGRTYKLEWYLVSTERPAEAVHAGSGGEPMLLSAADGMVLGARVDTQAQWSPDGQWFAYLRKDNDEVQVWRSRRDGRHQEKITHNAGNVLGFRWRHDSKAIFFSADRGRAQRRKQLEQEGDRGYLLDGRFLPIYSVRPLSSTCGERQEGSMAVVSSCVPSQWVAEFGEPEREVKPEVANSTGGVEDILPSLPRKVHIHATDGAGRTAWIENEDVRANAGFDPPLTLFADGVRCNVPQCHGKLKQVMWVGDEVIFVRHEDHSYSIPAIYAWRPRQASVRLLHRHDGVVASCQPAGARVVCLHETPKTPRKIVAIRVSDGQIATLWDPNPTFARFELGVVERIEWQDAFGNDTFAHVVYPPDFQKGRRYPLVVVQYRSRGFLKGGVGNEYPVFPLAAKGFVVLSFDRPEDQEQRTQYVVDSGLEVQGKLEAENWKGGYLRRQALSALDSILDRLDGEGVIDPARLGITGLSNGAETVTSALIGSRRYAAAAFSGDQSSAQYDLQANPAMRAFFRAMLGADSRQAAIENWRPFSLSDNAHAVATPLLMQLSDHELISCMPNFVALQDAGKPVEAYVFPDEFHVKWQPQHKVAVAQRAIEWFQFWLQGYENDAPGKTDQYQRWRELRRRVGASGSRLSHHPTSREAGSEK